MGGGALEGGVQGYLANKEPPLPHLRQGPEGVRLFVNEVQGYLAHKKRF